MIKVEIGKKYYVQYGWSLYIGTAMTDNENTNVFNVGWFGRKIVVESTEVLGVAPPQKSWWERLTAKKDQ